MITCDTTSDPIKSSRKLPGIWNPEKKWFEYVWDIFDKFSGKKHSHAREKARRIRQIDRGILKKENGLI
jgi:hypothetical protein